MFKTIVNSGSHLTKMLKLPLRWSLFDIPRFIAGSRSFTSSSHLLNGTSTDTKEHDQILNDPEYRAIVRSFFATPGAGHRIFTVHPLEKTNRKRSEDDRKRIHLSIAESVTLVETLRNWKVITTVILNTKSSAQKQVFGSGNVEKLKNLIQGHSAISGLFVNVDRLTGLQLAELETVIGLPIFDRYSIVLQIFKEHAQTKVAKLQIALAEIPYFRVRLRISNDGNTERQGGGTSHIGGAGETFLELQKRLLQHREMKIKDAIKKITSHREVTSKKRDKQKLPTVAVVGYTNAGKTSLIKALTGDRNMRPLNQLFATLDVTTHGGYLPCRLPVLYVDTVGFIADIPTWLIEAFTATLDDVRKADVIIHVRDISHPDTVAQKECVLETLKRLYLDDSILENIIEVGNKVDLISSLDTASDEANTHYVSCTKETGLKQLLATVEKNLLVTTNHVTRTFRVESGGEACQWLYKEGAVTGVTSDEDDSQFMLMEVVLNEAANSKFRHHFGDCEVCE